MLRNAVLFVAGCALVGCGPRQDTTGGGARTPLGAPEKLVPAGKQALFMARGEGVQICVAEEKDGVLQSSFRSPQAILFDCKTGDKVGVHSAGPTWADDDGGRLTGKTLASEDAPNLTAPP